MQSSESVAKISTAIAEAQAEFRAVSKSGENKFDRYRYADLEDYVSTARPVLAKHGLAVLSSAEEIIALDDRTTKNGGCEHAVRVKVNVRLVHSSGEWVECSTWGEGQDRADKAVYKAITGARKYGLALALGLATSDDPERDENVGHDRENQRANGKPAAQRQAGPAKAAPMSKPNFEEALQQLDAAWLARGFDVEVADKILIEVLKKQRIAKLQDAPAEFFARLIQNIEEGKYEKFKQVPAGAAN